MACRRPWPPAGIFGVAKMIGLDQAPESYWYSDNMTVAVTQNVQGYTLGTVSPSTSSVGVALTAWQGPPQWQLRAQHQCRGIGL
jgi:hypothetical protein